MEQIAGKHAFVTGGGSGVGRGIAPPLRRPGAGGGAAPLAPQRAAASFPPWLGASSVVLGRPGAGGSAFCPGMVATGLGATTAKAEGRWDPSMDERPMPGIDAAKAAARVIAGIKGDWPYILTHGENRAPVAARTEVILAAFD